jgi:predicted RND superfamily exporter protein
MTDTLKQEERWRDSLKLRLPTAARKLATAKDAGDMGGIGALILRFRLSIGLLLVAITLFMAYGVSKVKFATSFVDFFPRGNPNTVLYEKYRQDFGGAQSLVIAIRVKNGDIFNFATLKKIQEINGAVDALSGVDHVSVQSLASFRVAYVEPVPGGLIGKPYMYPNIPKNEAELANLKRMVEVHKAALSSLVSRDNRTTIVAATFNEQVLNYRALFDSVRELVKRETDANHQIYVGGEPMVRGYGYHYLPQITVCFVVAILAMIILLYFSLGHRSRWWAPIITGSLSAVWGLGFVGWMGYNFDPVMLVIPFILTARDLSHGIQWQGRYYNELDNSHDKYAAIVLTTNYMLPPGFLSIIADIGGIIFVSLGGIPVLHHIGLAGAVWLASSLTMVFVFEPVFLSFSPVPRLKGESFGERLGEFLPSFFTRALDTFIHIPITSGKVRAGMLAAAAAFILWGVSAGQRSKIGYSTPGTPLYAPHAKVNQDLEAIAQDFPLDEGWVVVTAPRYPSAQSMVGPPNLRAMDDLRTFLLSKDSRVVDVVSAASTIIKPSNQSFHNGHPKYFALPDSTTLGANLWYLFASGMAPGEAERYITNVDGFLGVVRIQLKDHTYETLNQLQSELNEFENNQIKSDPSLDKIKFEYLGGLAGLYAAANTVLFRLDIINIAFVLLVVLVFSTIEFRAITAGLLFVLSCILANFAAFIYMGIRGIGLTIDTVPVISLGIGLGVDYGIYIVARIRDEVGRGHSVEDAIVIAITGTGAAVFSTFAVMVGGILPWVFSPLQFHSQMSVLLSFLMFTNMVAGILILPAFIAWARPGFITKYRGSEKTQPAQVIAKAV